MDKHFFLSVNISLGKYQEFIDKFAAYAKDRASSYVCVCNVHMTIEAYFDKEFATVVNQADIVTPDGLPLGKGLDFLYGIKQDRVSGPDLMPSLLERAEKDGLGVYFYGSTDEILLKLTTFCKSRYPNLIISGSISPPFRVLSEDEKNEHINQINSSGANIVFVALGCPKQEKWMASMKSKINAIMLGVGGAFPMLVGVEKRAPLWMQKFMLEWFFRLIQDPKRLFKRYLVTNTYFVILLLREKIINKIGRK
ncbi:WecB/TagA/CpsF family glycosyltransferase [Emticicia oligotrophica]|uniref:WecB/TagA/CpsF family glycosyltransferase n=1 Tax=Emticicia oligotrophica TaxID=312279 RepID=UPI00273AA27D|nr:WecB/TagA/CpsF family glycosyltransferase [Emticicia oligotrophica]